MRRLLAFLLASLWASTAFATTIVNIGNHNQTAANTNVLTTVSNLCAAGSTIVLSTSYVVLADTLLSVSDSAGNTWHAPFDNITGTGVGIGSAYAANTSFDLPIGGTITATFNGSTNTEVSAACIRNMVGTVSIDTNNNTSQGLAATAATTVSTGTLATATDVAFGMLATPTSAGTATCNGAFTKTGITITTPSMTVCFQILAATTSVDFSPTWTNAVNYVSDVVSFKGVTSASTCRMIMLGAGSC